MKIEFEADQAEKEILATLKKHNYSSEVIAKEVARLAYNIIFLQRNQERLDRNLRQLYHVIEKEGFIEKVVFDDSEEDVGK